ncbi:MAG: right-handed parallel beta-helix repeat-containing protein, partial [Limisphaerales bacterium]
MTAPLEVKVGLAAIAAMLSACFCYGQPYFISPAGDDVNPGTPEQPFATLQRAQQAVRHKRGDVFLRGGTYYLPSTLVFTAQDSGTRQEPVIFQNYQGEKPVISGGTKLENLDWQPYTNGIYQAQVPADLQTEELLVNGERQILARYPNFDPKAQYFDGFAADAISVQRAARWSDPAGGYFHAMHPALWGDFTWRILGKDAHGEVRLEGGWQNNRGAAAHAQIRFVENIFEELDAPGEWFLNGKTHT